MNWRRVERRREVESAAAPHSSFSCALLLSRARPLLLQGTTPSCAASPPAHCPCFNRSQRDTKAGASPRQSPLTLKNNMMRARVSRAPPSAPALPSRRPPTVPPARPRLARPARPGGPGDDGPSSSSPAAASSAAAAATAAAAAAAAASAGGPAGGRGVPPASPPSPPPIVRVRLSVHYRVHRDGEWMRGGE